MITVPWESLQPETLAALIEEFVSRAGTDYGIVEASFERKNEDVRRQLKRGEIVIVFDPQSESCDLRLMP